MNGDISYDLVMEDSMSFAEGSYKIGDQPWQVFIVSKDSVKKCEAKAGRWASGATGVHFRIPVEFRLNRVLVEQLLSDHLGVVAWIEACGPDSMQLR